MNAMLRKLQLGTMAFLLTIVASAQEQDYVQLMNDKQASFEQIQNAFEKHWAGKTPSKGSGYKPFKRFEDFAKKRINPNTGVFENPMSSVLEYTKYFLVNGLNKSVSTQSQWVPIQPANIIPSSGGGTGRLNCAAIHPTNPNTIFVGSVGGGIWRTYDGGQTWMSNTDQFGSLSISDIAFNPKNPNIIYAATGDIEGALMPHYSVGVLKSIDAGLTWSTTGLIYNPSQMKAMGRLLIHPDFPDTVFAAGLDGIYKTYNGGTNWTLKHSGTIKDMEFKPGDPNVIYAAYQAVFRSTNNGETFSTIPGLTSPSRIALAVTPANANYVYALAGNAAHTLQGVYRSTNSASNFTLMAATPNIMTNTPFGTGGYGQTWYDITIIASPLNADEIYTGGINIWKSLNGGQTLFPLTHWLGDSALPKVHSDMHDLKYNNGDVWVANDGGLFKTSDGGSTWSDKSSGLATAQIYRLNTSQLDTSGLTISGWQDNGTNLYKHNVSAKHIFEQDGMDCQINQSNNNFLYCGIQQGGLAKSTNGGNSAAYILTNTGTGVNSQSAWITPFVLDPQNQNTIYIGKAQIYTSTDTGATWTQLGTIPGSNNIDQLAIYSSPTTRYIYASKGAGLFVKKGSANYITITNGLPTLGTISDIEVMQTDSSKVWVTYSLYNSQTVFYSTNAGATWTNISAGLPATPVNCIIHEKNTNNIYVGTDIGVFYKAISSASWSPYGLGLPNVIITDMDIQYAVGKLRISTFGRGMWETKVFQAPTTAPIAAFGVSTQTACQSQKVVFTDNSTNSPTSRTWTFLGGTPNTSNLYSPSIAYNSPGVYPVKLVVSNAIGSDSITQINYITVNAGPNVSVDSGTILKCKYDDTVSFVGFGGLNYSWSPAAGVSSPSNGVFNCFTQLPGTYIIKGFDAAGCFGTDTVVVSLKQPPFSLTIANIAGGFRVISSNPPSTTTYQWFVNGAAIPNSNNDTLFANGTGAYTCQVTISNGCKRTSTNTINFTGVNALINTTTAIDILPNPNTGKFTLRIEGKESLGLIEITDVLGRKLSSQAIEGTQLSKSLTIGNAGVYFISVKNKAGKTIGIKKVMVE
jgi:PKD repeat protein/photosystem II stability/assembly factor-like uncharacterized protein